ncbi:MAG: hypothetical protein MI862_05290 [Desulfobacterales bacterium]|nr:hypothetical protein [Desulfobacterales bacterium]
MKREKRSKTLIAKFKDGFAEGWFFQVGEFFKPQLDIVHSPRRVDVVDENGVTKQIQKRDKNGVLKFKKDGSPFMVKMKKTVYVWTQGNQFCFEEGHTIYDSPKAYLAWSEALKHITYSCTILNAVPCMISSENKTTKGQVSFKLSKINKERTGLDPINIFNMTQPEFVDFLKTGRPHIKQKKVLKLIG